MADENTNVNLIVRGRDEASKELRKISGSLKRFRTEVTNTVRTVAVSAGIVFGVGSIVRAGKEMVSAASFAEESGNRFDEVFKEQAATSDAFAEQLGEDVRRSKIRIKDYMATLQDTFVPLGLTREKAAELSGELVKLGIDVASFKDVSDSEVIENFTSALVGQSKAVLKYGIVTNITALKQELFNQGITKSFEELSTQEKVLLRYNVIMRSTRDAQGDAVRTANSYANSLKALQDTMFQASAFIGSKALPFMADRLNEVRMNFEDLLDVAQNWRLSSEIIWTSAQLSLSEYSDDFEHFFKDIAKPSFDFFLKNWKDILVDMLNAQFAVNKNMGDNMFELVFELKDLLSGDTFDFTWQGLLDGFERTTEQFPDIVDKAASETTKELRGQLAEQLAAFDVAARGTRLPPPDRTGLDAPGAPGAIPGLTGRNRRRPAAVEARFLSFGGVADPQVEVAKNTKILINETRIARAATERLVRILESQTLNIPGGGRMQVAVAEANGV